MLVGILQDAAVTTASYSICYILEKHMKPFTDAEIIRNVLSALIKFYYLIFDKFSNTNQIISEIKKMQLSDSTCMRCIENIAKDIYNHIIGDLKNCKFFSLAFDSSTDISATSQCSTFVRM